MIRNQEWEVSFDESFENNGDSNFLTSFRFFMYQCLNISVSLDAAYRMAGQESASGEECLGASSNNVAACGMLPELEDTIRHLHKLVGNANVDPDRHIVLSFGSTQLINAAAFALLDRDNGTESVITAGKAPRYGDYQETGIYFNSELFRWENEDEDFTGKRVIEYITHPNNPDGSLRVRSVPDSFAVWDHAYYWPHFTPITGPVGEGERYKDSDVVLFTLSKMTGHAGTRLGWAITKDAEVARRMAEFIKMTTNSLSREVQLRANALLTHIVKTDGKIFNYAADEMERRWDKLTSIFGNGPEPGLDKKDIFSLQTLEESAYCNFRKAVKRPSPAYVWFTCNREEEANYVLDKKTVRERVANYGIPSDPSRYGEEVGCYAHILHHSVSTSKGNSYGAGQESVRIEMLERKEDFDLVAERLEKMVVDMN